MKEKPRRYVVLDNLRSAYNVGSIFRTCDAAGIDKILLIGTTPSPIDRFGRPVREIEKTSLGAVQTVPWEYLSTAEEACAFLMKEQVDIIAVEQDARSIPYKKHTPGEACAYVFGNEVDGVSDIFLQSADEVIEIPMKGAKESLNVAVSVGIILFA